MNRYMLDLKTGDDIDRIALSGRIIADIFTWIAGLDLAGISTYELDRQVESKILAAGGRPAFKMVEGYNHATCISINHQVLHGIPSKKTFISPGDLVKVDIGVVKNGYVADACRTYGAGGLSSDRRHLLDVARRALDRAIGSIKPGARMGDLGAMILATASKEGFSVVTRYMGHGVGFKLHEPPPVPSVGKPGTGMQLVPGMVLALEPMITSGGPDVVELDDGWTVVTTDRSDAAEFEDTVAVTETGHLVLTR